MADGLIHLSPSKPLTIRLEEVVESLKSKNVKASKALIAEYALYLLLFKNHADPSAERIEKFREEKEDL